jgi:acyl-CoA dehydrogenase
MFYLVVIALVGIATALLYMGRGWLAWTLPGALALVAWCAAGEPSLWWFLPVAALFLAAAVVTGVPALRRRLLGAPAMRVVGPILPRMGETERVALEAGTVWWDGALFSGAPDWRWLLDFRPRPLSERERAFLDGPVEELCRRLDDWDVTQQRDLPPEIWEFLRRERFFGMILPEEYEGLGFSAAAHSAVVTKVASRSVAAAVTVMVPNSLGPGSCCCTTAPTSRRRLPAAPGPRRGDPVLRAHGPGGGQRRRRHPERGHRVPRKLRGREVLGMRLDWRKRYITLGPVATLIGLAFKLRDPDGLLGGKEELGITCALIPADLPGIEIGRRHDPMGIAFTTVRTRVATCSCRWTSSSAAPPWRARAGAC